MNSIRKLQKDLIKEGARFVVTREIHIGRKLTPIGTRGTVLEIEKYGNDYNVTVKFDGIPDRTKELFCVLDDDCIEFY